MRQTYLVDVVLGQIRKLPCSRHAQGGVEEAPLAEAQQVVHSCGIRGPPSDLAQGYGSLHTHPARGNPSEQSTCLLQETNKSMQSLAEQCCPHFLPVRSPRAEHEAMREGAQGGG